MPSQLNTANAGKGHIFNPEILREYDIRGRVGESLNVEDAYAVRHTGQAPRRLSSLRWL